MRSHELPTTPPPRREATMITRTLSIASTIFIACRLYLLTPRQRDDRGDAVGWLIVVGASVGIAYFAGDSVMTFARGLAGRLGGG